MEENSRDKILHKDHISPSIWISWNPPLGGMWPNESHYCLSIFRKEKKRKNILKAWNLNLMVVQEEVTIVFLMFLLEAIIVLFCVRASRTKEIVSMHKGTVLHFCFTIWCWAAKYCL